MSIPTVALSIVSAAITGAPLANGSVILQLTAQDILTGTGGAIVPATPVTVPLDANGLATTNSFPNVLGAMGTQTKVTLCDSTGAEVGYGLATIPNYACNLHDVMDLAPPPSLTSAQAGANLSRAWATQPTTPVDGTDFSAKEMAQGSAAGTGGSAKSWALTEGEDVPGAAAGSRSAKSWAQEDLIGTEYGGSAKDWAQGAGLIDGTNKSAKGYASDAGGSAAAAAGDAAQTSSDRTQTGLDRTQTDADVVAANGTLAQIQGLQLTAVAAASLAMAMAAAAASVAQQDLSGVSGGALLRSPNAIVGIAHCDTSKDSDGGAWTQRCEDHSFYTESLVGAWIYSALANFMGFGAGNSSGTQAVNTPEIVARAMGGTLGANIATGTWASMDGGAVTGSAGNFTVTPASGHFDGAQMTVPTTPGTTYLVMGGVPGANQGRIYINGTASLTSPYANAGALQGGFAFVVTAPGSQLVLMPGSNVAAQSVSYTNFSVQPVTAWAPSGSFYPDATTGKYQRLWGNLLQSNTDLTTANWTRRGAGSVGALGVTDPLGGTGAQTLSGIGTSGVDDVYQQISGPTSAVGAGYTPGVWINRVSTSGVLSIANPSNSSAGSWQIDLAVLGAGWQFITASSPGVTVVAPFTVFTGGGLGLHFRAISGGPLSFSVYRPTISYGSTAVQEDKALNVLGTTEVFRGSKARPFRYGITPTESGFLTLFDALEPGRPMWMRFVANVANNAIPGSIVGNLLYIQGGLVVGTNAGLVLIDLAGDRVFNWSAAGLRRYRGKIADRNAGLGWDVVDSTKVVPSAVAMVAACLMPDAPVDPMTGLQVPTIAATTSTVGATLIQNNGSVVASSQTGSWNAITLTPWLLTFATSSLSNIQYALQPGKLGASFATTALSTTNPQMTTFGANGSSLVSGGRSMLFRRLASNRLQGLRFNEATPAASPCFDLSDTYNTGWMVDPRRAFLCDTTVGAISNPSTVADRSYKASSLTVFGTLTRSQVATGAQLVAYSSFSPANYLQEPGYSSDLDMTTLDACGYGTLPATLPSSSFPVIGSQLWADGSVAFSGSASRVSAGVYRIYSPDGTYSAADDTVATAGLWYQVTFNVDSITTVGNGLQIDGVATSPSFTTTGPQSALVKAIAGAIGIKRGSTACDIQVSSVSVKQIGPAIAEDRSAPGLTGAYWRWGCWPDGTIYAFATDGTNTRTVTSPAAYNTGIRTDIRVTLDSGGTMTLWIGGVAVATATGTPLTTLANASAVHTVGIDGGLTAPWPGDLCLVRVGPTVPGADAIAWMHEQEKELFVAGAQVTLPDSGNVVSGDWDESQGKFKLASAANESSFSLALVRTASATVPAGSFTGVAHRNGIRVVSRSTTNPGCDITMPALNLQEQLNRREEVFARRVAANEEFDWTPTFTANTTNGLAQITVTGSSLVYGANAPPPVGALVTGVGIQAGTRILGISGTAVNLSLPCTATGSGVTVSFLSFPLPTNYETRSVFGTAGLKREGNGFDYQRQYDGFREAPVFTSGMTGFVRVSARRIAA